MADLVMTPVALALCAAMNVSPCTLERLDRAYLDGLAGCPDHAQGNRHRLLPAGARQKVHRGRAVQVARLPARRGLSLPGGSGFMKESPLRVPQHRGAGASA
jgi:hypothetical protein